MLNKYFTLNVLFFTYLSLGAQVKPGDLNETFEINQNGACNYTIPIEVVPGIQHMQPNLNLTYDSQGDNGIAGVGFSLNGISSITRTPRTIAVDGTSGSINYNENDRFALGASRLININGIYGHNNCEYRTEIEGWNKIISYKSKEFEGNGPEYFIVYTSDGTRMEFGSSPNARELASPENKSVRTWHLNKLIDLNGNSLEIKYSQNPLNSTTNSSYERLYPIEIIYGSNLSQNIKGNRSVKFLYQNRPDTTVIYMGGFPIQNSLRLKAIQTYLMNNIVSHYQLNYNSSSSTKRSIVSSVQRFSNQSLKKGLSPSTFKWQKGINSFSKTTVCKNQFKTSVIPPQLADVNGDGFMDIIGIVEDGVQVSLSNGKQFGEATTWTRDFSPATFWSTNMLRQLVDVNGDGLADIIGFKDDGVHIGLSTGKAFDIQKKKLFPYFKAWNTHINPIQLTDVNGDGILDIIGFGTEEVLVALANPKKTDGFDKPRPWTKKFTSAQHWINSWPRMLADVNGDGLADIIGFSDTKVVVGISTGESFNSEIWPQYAQFTGAQGWVSSWPLMLSDLNNDGLADIVGFSATEVKVGMSTGKDFSTPNIWSNEFTASAGWSSKNQRKLMDANGDGLVDILGFGNDSLYIALSTGTKFDEAIGWSSDFTSSTFWSSNMPRFVTDANGDGMGDILGFKSDSLFIGLSAGLIPDKITTITRSTGARYEVSYAPLSNPAVYRQTAIQDLGSVVSQNNPFVFAQQTAAIPSYRPAALLGGLYYVVSHYQVNSAPDEEHKFSYFYTKHYEDAFIDINGRGWMGFKKCKTIKNNNGNVRTTRYHQNFPLTGSIQQVSLYEDELSQTQLVKKTKQQFEVKTGTTTVIPGQKIYIVSQSSNQHLFYNKEQLGHAIGEQYHYDNYGNLKQTRYQNLIHATNGQSIDPDDDIVELYAYNNDTINWRLGYPTFKKTSKIASGDIEVFDAAHDFELYQFQYDKQFNLITEGQWDNVHKQFLTTSYLFDNFGNRKTIIETTGVKYELDYDTVFHTYPTRYQSPRNEFHKRLIAYSGFDPRFGVLAIGIDYNGQSSITQYDDFGRPVSNQVVAPPDLTSNSQLKKARLSKYITTVPKHKIPDQMVTIDTTIYSWENNISTTKTIHLANWKTNSTIWQQLYFDGLGRTYKVSVQDSIHGSKTLQNIKFNARDQVIEAHLPYFEENTALSLHIEYDILERTRRLTYPVDEQQYNTINSSYIAQKRGFKVLEQIGEGSLLYEQTSYFQYFSNQERLTSLVTAGATTDYKYDLLGRTTAILSPAGQDKKRLTNNYSYDAMGRVIHQGTTPSRGSFYFEYDQYGRLVGQQQANGKLTYRYDSLGRVLEERYPENEWVQYIYDEPNVSNGLGNLTTALNYASADELESANHYRYDAYGQAIADSLYIASDIQQGYLSQFMFDPLGRPTRLINPDGSKVNYRYTDFNLSTVQQGKLGVEYKNYTALGQPQSVNYANGVKNKYTYAVTGAIEQIKAYNHTDTLYQQNFRWDKMGKLTAIYDSLSRTKREYRYTNLRLTNGDSTKYLYDQAGNLTTKGDVAYQYKGEQWISALTKGGKTYQAKYDTMGNMTLRILGSDTTEFQFNTRSQLTAARKNGDAKQAEYLYDYTGTRIYKKEPNGDQQLFINPMYSQTLRNDTVQHIYMPKGLFGSIAQYTTNGSTIYLQTNHQGSTVLLTNEAGETLGEIVYSPYGEITKSNSQEVQDLYTGWGYDEYTDLYYMDFRYYDPQSGRFMSADNVFGAPVTRQDAVNSYAYVLNSPMVFVDENGHWADLGRGTINMIIWILARRYFVENPTLFRLDVEHPTAVSLPDLVIFFNFIVSPLTAEIIKCFNKKKEDLLPIIHDAIKKFRKDWDKDKGGGGGGSGSGLGNVQVSINTHLQANRGNSKGQTANRNRGKNNQASNALSETSLNFDLGDIDSRLASGLRNALNQSARIGSAAMNTISRNQGTIAATATGAIAGSAVGSTIGILMGAKKGAKAGSIVAISMGAKKGAKIGAVGGPKGAAIGATIGVGLGLTLSLF